jgi:hypothetical protein
MNPHEVPEDVAIAAEAAWSNGANWKEIVAAALNAWPWGIIVPQKETSE